MSSDLYTIEVPGKLADDRPIITTYYDVEWSKIPIYVKMHAADHVNAIKQERWLDREAKVTVLDPIEWSDEAIAGSQKPREKLAVPAHRPKPAPELEITGGDYADLVNVIVGAH